MKAVYNFTEIDTAQTPADWHSRAFQYGDGLFETMMLQKGTVRFLADHYQRLTEGMAALQMTVPPGLSAEYLQAAARDLAKFAQNADAIGDIKNPATGGNAHSIIPPSNHSKLTRRVRLHVWRKPGGLYTPTSHGADFLLAVQPSVPPVVSIKEKVIFYEDIRLCRSAISPFKTGSALPYVMAGLARKNAGADDAILLDTNGFVAECVASNLFWLKIANPAIGRNAQNENPAAGNATVFTPSLASGCVAGVMRKNIIDGLSRHGLSVEERLFKKADLLAADAVFCCNVAGIQWIRRIEDTVFDSLAEFTVVLQWILEQ